MKKQIVRLRGGDTLCPKTFAPEAGEQDSKQHLHEQVHNCPVGFAGLLASNVGGGPPSWIVNVEQSHDNTPCLCKPREAAWQRHHTR